MAQMENLTDHGLKEEEVTEANDMRNRMCVEKQDKRLALSRPELQQEVLDAGELGLEDEL